VTEFLAANLAPLMFAAMVVFLLLGYPVAFALAANGILFALVGIELGLLDASLFQALPQRIWAVMANETLLAVPFFTLMGLILERSGMAEDLLDTIGRLFGALRGGLAYAVVFVGTLLAATTGVVAASVISMGLIALPIMLRYGYDRRLAAGTIAASGTLAQIVPPSLVLIVLADQLGPRWATCTPARWRRRWRWPACTCCTWRAPPCSGRTGRRRCRRRRGRASRRGSWRGAWCSCCCRRWG
jgi:TRAP-type mannitol/chloroaromatic compound transport system permease large subunit